MAEAKAEHEAAMGRVAVASGMQSAVIATARRQVDDSYSKAARQRTTHRSIRNTRKKRADQDRQFAMALGRQVRARVCACV